MKKMERNKYTEYALDVINGKVTACEYVKMACRRYLNWFMRDDIYFDAKAVDRVVKFCSLLKHFTGKHNGKPFILSPFQFWIVCSIYGWKWKETKLRVIKNVYIELARKNGKSFFVAALALYNLVSDGEANAEVELIANSTKQAKIVFSMCQNLVAGLDPRRKLFRTLRDSIKYHTTNSLLQVLSTDAHANDGWNSSLFVVDEYHSAQNSLMYDVMKSSQGNREQPLSIVITTAGFNLFSPCYEMRKVNVEILRGLKEDDTVFAAIYTLDESDDWSNPEVWIKANPNLDISVKREYLQEQVTQAKNNPSLEVGTRTKNFNQWLTSSSVWLSADDIGKVTANVELPNDSETVLYLGVDLSAVSDLTALAAMWEKDGKFYFKNYYYLPQSCLSNNPNAELYKEWQRQGFLTVTNGNVVDYDYLLKDILSISESNIIQTVAYDQYNATQWAINATAEGLPLKPFSQALWNFNKPTKEFERLTKMEKVVIDNNPVTRWCFSNVALKSDHNENVKPVKGGSDNDKIDGVIASLEALGAYLATPQYNNCI